jgi:hypothetical protein
VAAGLGGDRFVCVDDRAEQGVGGLEPFGGAAQALTFTSEVLSHFPAGGRQDGSLFSHAGQHFPDQVVDVKSSLTAMATNQSIQQSSAIDPKTSAGALLVGRIRRGAQFINHGRPP